jgi:hypothetical protein
VVADTSPETEHHHHHHTGHRWLDVALGVSAVVISVVSLFLAIQHGRVMERMLEASTWPYVVIDHSNASPGDRHLELSIINKGVGPAKIDSLEVFYNGAAQSDSGSLLRAILKPPDPHRHLPVVISDIVDSVLSAKEQVNFVTVEAKEYSPEEYARIDAAFKELAYRACFCSVFDECSVIDTRVALRPVAVKSCQVPNKPFLH